MEIRIFLLEEAIRGDLVELLFQLSGKKRSLNLENHPNVYCIGAFDGATLVGFAQLFILRKTTFTIAHLEDLIVHKDYRGKGIGTMIMKEVTACARRAGASTINLTTRLERIAAWSMFESLGFTKPGNSVFRLNLE